MRRATGATTTTFRSSRPRPRPLATALLALAALAGCRGVVNPCAPHTGTCIAVEVEADLPSDGPQGVSRLEVTLQLGQSAPVQRTTEPPSGPTGFPLVFPVVLGSYAGTVRLFIVAPEVRLQGQTALSVSQGEHVRVRVVLSSSPATDTSGSDGDQGGPPDGGASIPAARAGGAMAFFPERGTLVLFGGVGDHQRALGDTWEWRDGAWRLLRSSDEAPSARFGAAMAYDSARQVLFLCCGHNGKTVLNDAWQLDAKGRWTRLLDQNAPDSPPARAFAPMAPTPTGTLLLAGGLRPDTSEVLTDVWEYTGRWRQLPLELPTKLRGHALVKTAQELFLIGSDSGGARLQVWIYKAGSSNWTSPPSLPLHLEPQGLCGRLRPRWGRRLHPRRRDPG